MEKWARLLMHGAWYGMLTGMATIMVVLLMVAGGVWPGIGWLTAQTVVSDELGGRLKNGK